MSLLFKIKTPVKLGVMQVINKLMGAKWIVFIGLLVILLLPLQMVYAAPSNAGSDPSSFRCKSRVDIWYANDESSSVDSTEIKQSRDFIYQVTDGFYHSAASGAQGGLIGWAANPVSVVMPITENFQDQDDSGLASTGTVVDGDGLGVRETYIARANNVSGTNLADATQKLADLINAGNGRRTGVPQVAVFMTDAFKEQIKNEGHYTHGGSAWKTAAANLRAAGPDGTRIVLILLAEAVDAYNSSGTTRGIVDAVVGSDGLLLKTSSYANVADPTKGYIGQTIDAICSVGSPPNKDYSDAPADGSAAPNGTGTTTYGDARHDITPELKLGASIDGESASIASGAADGDGADDDAVSTFNTLTTLDQTYSVDVQVSNQTSNPARLMGWIDFDGNGRFDPDEAAMHTVASGTVDGTVALTWSNIPADIRAGRTYVRLRLTTDAINNQEPITAKTDGEVEDYALTIARDPSSFRCKSRVDIWYANDESSSVDSTEFTQSLDFIYQVTDGFYHSAATGAQGGLIGWAANPISVVMPITENFQDQGDSGLASTGTVVDGDGLGVREIYTVKVNNGSGTRLAEATQNLADLINSGNGRRTGVPQVAVFMTDAYDAQINNEGHYNSGGAAWEAAAANLRAAGPDGTRIVLILLAEAVGAYNNNATARGTIDAVVGSDGLLLKTSSYANVADPTKGYIGQTIDAICSVANLPNKDYSDAPADGSVAPNGTGTTAYGDAQHDITPELKLGASTDGESASIASDAADGDGADDDAVSTFNPLTALDRTYSVNVQVSNQTSNPARLMGWIDFDGNGRFDPDEAAMRMVASGTADGTVALTWSHIPVDIRAGRTYLRLRLTTESINNREPITAKKDGEVEDYLITIGDSGVNVSGRVYIDANSNAVEDAGESGIARTVVVLRDTVSGVCRSIHTNGGGYYSFVGVADGQYEIYQAHGETTPTPQNCGTSFARNPTGYRSTTPDVLSVVVAGDDVINQDFGEVAGSSGGPSGNNGVGIVFEPDHQSEILPGNVVFYAHTLTSQADGAVRFTMNSSDSTHGWSHVLYRDSDCNGTLNGTEGNTAINGLDSDIPVNAGGRICVIDKVYAPANVSAGGRHNVKITATFTYAGGTVTPVILEVTDVTTVLSAPVVPQDSQGGESRLKLKKTVENLTQGTPETESLNHAAPGDFLKYRIYYRNPGVSPITDLKVNDTVPAYTTLVDSSSACDVVPAGMTCTSTLNIDELLWEFTGALSGGAAGHVSYEVVVDQ